MTSYLSSFFLKYLVILVLEFQKRGMVKFRAAKTNETILIYLSNYFAKTQIPKKIQIRKLIILERDKEFDEKIINWKK